MKESNFYSDEFEQLIRDKTEQYKMYPSENVWKGVHNSLHTKRKWFIGSMAALVTGILFFAGRELIMPTAHVVAARKSAPAAGSMTDANKPAASGSILHTPLAAAYRSAGNSLTTHHTPEADNNPEDQDPAITRGLNISITNPVLTQSDLSGWLSQVVRLPEHAPDISVMKSGTDLAKQWRAAEDGSGGHGQDIAGVSTDVAAGHRNTADETTAREQNEDAPAVRSVIESLGAASAAGRASRLGGRLEGTGSGKGAVKGNTLSDDAGSSSKADAVAIAEANDIQRVNWLHDYAMNILPQSSARGRTFLQLTLSPTLNYRVLSGVDPQAAKFGATNMGSLNPSPGLGFEVGGSFLYRLTRNLSVKAGLQFNFIRYQIGTYSTTNWQTQGTSYLTPYGYYVDSMRQTTSRMSNPNNNNPPPKNVVTLDNDYYQLSAPIGIELRVLGNEKLQVHLGATVQPSYLLGTSAYMLNEDFTGYDKQASMFRKWNISGGIEAFLTYRMGNIRWQVGPEFRYQLFSSYTSTYPTTGDQYPISENLKSYGIKLGITKPLP